MIGLLVVGGCTGDPGEVEDLEAPAADAGEAGSGSGSSGSSGSSSGGSSGVDGGPVGEDAGDGVDAGEDPDGSSGPDADDPDASLPDEDAGDGGPDLPDAGDGSDAGDAGSVEVDAGADAAPPVFTVGGTVTGLAAGATVVLRNNGGDDLAVTQNGAFSFPTPLASGAGYVVTVLTNPTSPPQTCAVAAGSGTVPSADVTSVVVTCATVTWSIGGTVSGLVAGRTLVLQNNGADDLTITANGSFSFATKLPQGATFDVKVRTTPTSGQPLGETCAVTGGSGSVGAGNVTSIAVTCTPIKHTVSGTVVGLNGTVVLSNAGQAISVTGTTFAFAPQDWGSAYDVTVKDDPHSPPGPVEQTCTVASGSGIVTGDVTKVVVSCIDVPLPADYYVDAAKGSDANSGDAAAPFKTITHAMSVAAAKGGALRIQAAPGTYDAANGETFPIEVPAGCTLVGDEAQRGKANGGTTISGSAPAPVAVNTAVMIAAGARISGFDISVSNAPANYGVYAETANGKASRNTFAAGYGGVYVRTDGSLTVEDSTFRTSSYGLLVGGVADIVANDFQETVSWPVAVGGSDACVIKGNTVEGDGTAGFQIQHGASAIEGNTFTRSAGYTYGAIVAAFDATPVVRNNVIEATAGTAILAISTSAPDLGTDVDPGNNVLGKGGAVVGLAQESTKDISAIGNTWIHTPPQCDVDITIAGGAGKVVFAASGGATSCP